MDSILDRVRLIFNFESLANRALDFAPDLVVAFLAFFGFWLLWRFARRLLEPALVRGGIDETARTFIHTVLQYSLMTFGTVTALAQVGVDTTSVLTSLGVAGLTIGFAARDALSNVISGIFIFLDRPFVIGDLVEVGDAYGRVSNITMRSTRLVTPDGKMLAIPNSTIVNSPVASYTNFPHLRLDVPVTVGVAEDLGRVRACLLEVARTHGCLSEPAPVVAVTALGDYNVEVELRAWIADEQGHLAERVALREEMYVALSGAGVDMPFETLKFEPVEVRVASAAEAAA